MRMPMPNIHKCERFWALKLRCPYSQNSQLHEQPQSLDQFRELSRGSIEAERDSEVWQNVKKQLGGRTTKSTGNSRGFPHAWQSLPPKSRGTSATRPRRAGSSITGKMGTIETHFARGYSRLLKAEGRSKDVFGLTSKESRPGIGRLYSQLQTDDVRRFEEDGNLEDKIQGQSDRDAAYGLDQGARRLPGKGRGEPGRSGAVDPRITEDEKGTSRDRLNESPSFRTGAPLLKNWTQYLKELTTGGFGPKRRGSVDEDRGRGAFRTSWRGNLS